MSTVNGTGSSSSSSGSTTSGATDRLNNLGTSDFIKLLVTELQQQDPMSPMDNSQILQQVGQIRSIQSTQQLTDTLSAVLLGQNMATGSGLLNKQVVALDDNANKVTGVVDRVTIENGTVKLHIGDSTVSLTNVSEIDSGASS
jgi:flagellar basal-body rod modification protein FlgD